VAAETGNLDDILASLTLVGSWDESHPLHYEVKPLVEQWSWVALKEAQQKLLNSDLDDAVALIDYIPKASPVYERAQDSLQAWNQEWEQGDKIWQQAQTALKNQDWGHASKQVLALAELNNQHWRTHQVQALSQQIRQERQARRQLARAIDLASGGGIPQLGAALRTASQIDANTYAYQTAQPYMDRWSDWLLNLGLDQWYASDLNQAISLGRNAAVNPNRAKAAQELIWLSQSRQMAQASVGTWRTSPDQLVQLYRAMVVANQIPADSPYYPQAQSSVATWSTHLADLTKVQMAQIPGRLQNLETLKLAIDQAAQIPVGNPRRQQAQTLIAHWRLEAERVEDRPYLTRAHQLAKPGTIEALHQAIETASQIAMNRALRNEAQSWIYVWNNQIEVLQDRPILTAARELAKEGNYSQAIAKASNVKSGRALFQEAQAAIAGWRREIYAIEQAQQRALRRAADRRRQVEAAPATSPFPAAVPATQETTAAPDVPPTVPQRVAPVPVQSAPTRQPLPQRIETVPGNAPPAGIARPTPTLPSPLESSESQPTRVERSSPAAPVSPGPTTPPPVTPEPAPVPVETAPAADIPPNLPIPAAPAPQLPVVPAQPLAPSQGNDAADPSPMPSPPEAVNPNQPSVSAAPVPEQALRIQTSKESTVLFTGALYAGR
jgi:hypothetical protein